MNSTDISRNDLKDSIYMNMAHEISRLSRDENTKIGCVIVARDGTPVSWGYNGTLAGVNDNKIPHSRKEETIRYMRIENNTPPVWCSVITNKYPWMRHAERNAIKFASPEKLKGATLYVNAFPCEACALEIADSGITRVVVMTPKSNDPNSTINANRELSEAILAQKNMQMTIDWVDVTLVGA